MRSSSIASGEAVIFAVMSLSPARLPPQRHPIGHHRCLTWFRTHASWFRTHASPAVPARYLRTPKSFTVSTIRSPACARVFRSATAMMRLEFAQLLCLPPQLPRKGIALFRSRTNAHPYSLREAPNGNYQRMD
jgi:hypothetical protein